MRVPRGKNVFFALILSIAVLTVGCAQALLGGAPPPDANAKLESVSTSGVTAPGSIPQVVPLDTTLGRAYFEREIRFLCSHRPRALAKALDITNVATFTDQGSNWAVSYLRQLPQNMTTAGGQKQMIETATVFSNGIVSGPLIQRIELEVCAR